MENVVDTDIGALVLALNPFNSIIPWYGNQCVLASGEFGDGKTEAVKIVIK